MDEGYLSSHTQWQGRFWLPGQESNDQRGILTYIPDRGVRLALIGGFDDSQWLTGSMPGQRVRSRRSRSWPVIHGTVGSAAVTLLNCVVERSTSYVMGASVAEQELRAERLLLGVRLNAEHPQAFAGVEIELENLTEWHRVPEVVYGIEQHENPARRMRWRIEVEPIDSVVVHSGDLTIELGRWYRLPSHDLRRGRMASSTFGTSRVTLRSEEPRSVGEWSEAAQGFQDLLTLAMDTPCAILRLTLIPTEELFCDQRAAARGEIRVFARHNLVGDPDAPGAEGDDALFTLGDEGVSFETLLPQWLSVRAKFRITLDMILGLRYVNTGYVRTQLITVVAAAEAMHEALGLDPPIPNPEFKRIRKLLGEHVPEELRQWLREKLGRNNHTLRQRLVDLASLPDSGIMQAMLPNVEAWAEATKNARNLVAHGGQSEADLRLHEAITRVTRAVVIMNLLHHLKIPRDRVAHVLTESPELRAVSLLANEYWPAA